MIMQMTSLNPKTAIPRVAAEAVERERLVDLLRYAGSKRLTIVRAPAGYGKTTMLSQWFGQSYESVAWLSIDAIDNDPIRFWKYVIYTVSETFMSETDTTQFRLSDSHSPIELLIDSFLNEIGSNPGILRIVIEDYHLIDNQSIHDMLARFITYLPSNVRVYMTSRTKLPLPIAKWRVKGWITEIGMEQLRFTYEEVERFFAKRGLMSEEVATIQQVLDTTEGWAAGIQLTSLSGSMTVANERNSDLVSNARPSLIEFLSQEILASLPLSTQDFLVRTSLVNQLEPGICNALTNRTDSESILLELERSGLFITRLHASEPIFRYHHLFADALQIEMKNHYSQQEISLNYKNTAILLREQGDFISGIELALTGQLYEVADIWITAHILEVFLSGQTTTFMRWVQQLRDADYPVNVETLIMNVITFTNINALEEAKQLIEELECRQVHEQWKQKDDYQGMAYILETVKAFVLISNCEDIERALGIILSQMKIGRVISRWDDIPMQYNQFEPQTLRTSLGSRGKLWAVKEFLPFLDLFRESEFNEQNMTGFSYAVQAEALYEKDCVYEASIVLEEALRYGHRFKDPSLIVPMYLLKGRIYATKGQFIEAHALLDYAMETMKERYWIGTLRTMKAYCYLLEGDPLRAELELYQSTAIHNQRVESGQEFWLLMQTRILLDKGQAKEALEVVGRVKEKALLERQISTIVEAGVLEAICQLYLSDKEAAFTALHEALKEGAPYGYVRTFLNEIRVIPLLKEYVKVRQQGIRAEWDAAPLNYVERLTAEDLSDSVQNPMLDMLTPRERDVLQLLARGASNSEIASQLFLSEGTVRVYLSKIYSKLGVDSRTQAVLLANEWEWPDGSKVIK